MDIDLKLLQHAVVLSRHRHFGRAALALRISQPTLSRNIAALEKKLGMRVFERSRRDVVATPAGDDVLKMADELVARAEAISNQLQVVRDGRGGRLRVAAGSYIHDIAVQPAAIDLTNANPSIRLELLEREWTAVLPMLMTDRVDFVVFDIVALKNMPALRVESLGALQGSYFCRAGHPLLKKKAPLQPEDLRKYPFVMSSMPHSHLWLVDGLDDGLSIEPVTGDLLPSIAVSSFRVVRDLVAGTDAFGIGHMSQIGDGMKAKQLAVLDLPWRSKPPTAQMGIAYKRERTLSPAARAFIGLIRKRVRAAAGF